MTAELGPQVAFRLDANVPACCSGKSEGLPSAGDILACENRREPGPCLEVNEGTAATSQRPVLDREATK